jgi:hypothetical protein
MTLADLCSPDYSDTMGEKSISKFIISMIGNEASPSKSDRNIKVISLVTVVTTSQAVRERNKRAVEQ